MGKRKPANATEMMFDPEVGATIIVNETAVATPDIYQAIVDQQPEVAALIRWGNQTQAIGRFGGIFQRDRYVTPGSMFEQMKVCLDAVETDDIVGGVADITESITLSDLRVSCYDEDEEELWNQIMAYLDMTSRFREIWREVFAISNCYIAIAWGKQDFKLRGLTEKGNKKKKSYTGINVPLGLTILDPLKVVPVGNFMFNQERLVYIANQTEAQNFDFVLAGTNTTDEIVDSLVEGRYIPTIEEKRELQALVGKGVNLSYLFLLKKENVFRHTSTRPQYARYAMPRMKSVFELLDLKQQLREMDRAHLVGGPLNVTQRIMTPSGWKMIGNSRVGDKIFTPDGSLANIIGVYPQGILKDMYKVVFTDDSEVVCDGGHYWTVINRRGNKRTITLNDILGEGLKDQGKTYRHRIPMTLPVILDEKEYPLDPYLLGYMLGDGSFSQSSPKITSAEEFDLPWEVCLPEGIAAINHEKRDGFAPQYLLKSSVWQNNPLITGLRQVGLWGVAGADKFIPEEYLWGSIAQRFSLLQGLLDSDGSNVGAGCVEFSNCSKALIDGVQYLVQSLGGTARVSERKVRSNEKPCYRIHISLNGKEAPFRLKRKVNSWIPRKYPRLRAIKNVIPVSPSPAICIKIDREDGLFLTESFVATHNTNFIVLVKKGTDELPAKPAEVSALATQVRQAARVPVIVGDHRLAVEIITPKMDVVLSPEKYNALDARIAARLFQIFFTGNYAAGAKGDDSIKLARLVAKGMESRRGAIKDTLQKYIIDQIFIKNPGLTYEPDLMCHPKRISLDFDPNVLNYLQELRDRGDISRETLLGELDLSQAEEALKRDREKEHYDDIFEPILPPAIKQATLPPARGKGSGTKPNATPSANPKAAGKKGGRTGGTNPKSATTSTPQRGPAKQ